MIILLGKDIESCEKKTKDIEILDAEVVLEEKPTSVESEAETFDLAEIEAASSPVNLPAVVPEGKEVALYDGHKVGDPLTSYMREIQRHPLLSVEQERALTKALYETGDLEIAKKLVVSNLRLVVKIAMEYRRT